MNKFLYKKVIPAIMAITMIATVTACGNKVENQVETSSTTQEATQSTTEVAVDPLGKYEPGVTITSVRNFNSSMTFPSGDDAANNAYTRAIKEDLGIDLKFKWVVDVAQEKTKVATMLASGDIPDFFFADSATYKKLVESDAVADMTEIYPKYASELLKKQDADFKEGFDSSVINGKQYGIARLGWGTISLPQTMWLRADWLAQSGMSVPKTITELEDVAKKFVSDHPGSYGLAIDKVMTNPYNSIIGISNIYHSYPKHWVKDAQGQIVYGSIQPEMKTALTELQNMYKAGIISKEFGVKDANKTAEDIAAGKVGIMFGANWMGYYPLLDSQKNDPKADWKPYDLPTADNKPTNLQGAWPVEGYYVVNKSCKNPEAVVKMLNWYMKNESAGTFMKAPFAELNWTTTPCYQTFPNRDYNAVEKVGAALKSGDASNLTDYEKTTYYNDAFKWKDKKDVLGFGRYMQYADEGSYAILKKYVDENKILLNELKGSEPEGFAGTKATLEKLEDDAFTKIIMGASIDDFDKFVESWNKLGGEAATKEINDTYNKK